MNRIKREFLEEQFQDKITLNLEELFKIQKNTNGDHEFVTVFRTVFPGPFDLDPLEVETTYFKDINEVIADLENRPDMYSPTAKILVH